MKPWGSLVAAAMAVILAGCGGSAATGGAGPTLTPAASSTAAANSASPTPSPTTCAIDPLPGLCVGRSATSVEEAAMITVGKPAAERDLNAVEASSCSGNQTC